MGRGFRIGHEAAAPAWVNDFVPRQWARLGNGLADIEMRFNPAMNPLYIADGSVRPPWGMSNWNIDGICAWSAGAKHPTEPYFLRFGGGHGDSGYNGIVRLSLSGAAPVFDHLQWGDGTVGHWNGTDLLGFDERDATFDDYASTGNPRSAHTYNGVVIAPNGILYATQGYKAGAAGLNGQTLWGYDLTAGTWSAVSTLPASGVTFRDFCHVPTLGGASGVLVGIGAGNASVERYNIDANTWTSSSSFSNTSGGARMVYVPAPWDCVVGLNSQTTGGSGMFMHDFGRTALTGGNEHRPSITGTSPWVDSSYDLRCGVWVESLGAIVGWSWGEDLWTLTPPVSEDPRDAWTWGVLAADAGNTVTPMGRPGSQDPELFGSLFHHKFGSIDVICMSIRDTTGNSSIQPYFFRL